MATSIRDIRMISSSVPICMFFALVAGCSSSVRVGLTNAPVLGGLTADARVHDVIANGPDSCDRSLLQKQEVWRLQSSACGTRRGVTAVAPLRVSAPANASAWTTPLYSLGLCSSAGPGLEKRPETGFATIALSTSSAPACRGWAE
jgi:hypothetical protein